MPRLPFAAGLRQKALLIVLLLAAGGLQAQKFGYVNTVELIGLMPDAALADSALSAYQRDIQEQYNSYLQEYTVKSQEYFRIKDSVSEFVAENKLADLQALEKRIKEYEGKSNQLLQQKREELFAPVLRRAQDLIRQVAEDHGYRMIFDTANGSIAYAPEGDNVIGLLKKELGLE